MSHLVAIVNAFAASWADAFTRACWQGSLGIVLVWLLCRLWPAMPVSPRCWLWRLAYAKLLLGLVWLPPLALPLLPAPKPPAAPPLAQAVVTPAPALPDDAPPLAIGPVPSFAASASPPAAPLSSLAVAPLPPPRPTLPTVQTWLLVAWLLGVFASLSRVATAWHRACTLSRASRPLADEALQVDAADLCRRLRLHRIPPLHVADDLPSPLLLGLGRPTILLPAFVVSGSPRPEMRLMLAHELAHLARRDLWWNALPLLAQRLFFFHPLVWLAGHEWSLDQEIACDALAVETTGTPPSAYAEMLLGIATRRRTSAAPLFPTLAVAAPRHTLRRRLHAMQHIGTASRPRLILAAALVATLAVGGLLPWRVVAQSGKPLLTLPAAAEGDTTWQEQEQQRQADIAVKNAQLDAQLAEAQKHLSPAQSKTAQTFIRWINADYAANQLAVQLSEQQRADYVATHPNSLTPAQTAFVQKVILDKLNHKHISENVRAKLAAIPAKQQDRVAGLRYCDFNITVARSRALVQKQASVWQLRTEYSAPKQRRARDFSTQSQGTATKASLAQFARKVTGAAQSNHSDTAPVRVSPVMAEALDKQIARLEKQHSAQLEKQQRTANRLSPRTGAVEAETGAAREWTVIAFLKARRAGAAWAQASIASPEFSPGLKGQKLANLRRSEQQAQQDKYVAKKYVFLLATKLIMQESRLILPENQQPKQMKNTPNHVSAADADDAYRIYTFPRHGAHRVRIFAYGGTGQHLILDKLYHGRSETVTLPQEAGRTGNHLRILIHDNGVRITGMLP